MNIKVALLSSLFVVSCASAMEKTEPQKPTNSGWFQVSDDTSNDATTTPQKPAAPKNSGWFRVLGDNHEDHTKATAQAAVVTASWLRTRDTNEE